MKSMTNKLISFLLATGLMFSWTAAVSFAEDTQTYIESKLSDAVVLSVGSPNAMIGTAKAKIDKTNSFVVPVVENGSTLVPVRFVSEALGAKVDWEEATQTVSLSLKDTKIVFTIGEKIMSKNDQQIELLAAPKVDNARTLVPLRAISEGFGKEVFYDRGLIIISNEKNVFDPKTETAVLDQIIMDKLGSLPSVDSYENYKTLMSAMNERNNYAYTTRGGVMMTDTATSGMGSSGGATKSEGMVANSTPAPMATPATESISKDTNTGAAEYSGTNVQVQGVDEADVIKTDGTYIYKVRQNKVSIVKATPSNNMSLVSEIKFNVENYYPQEMYVDGSKLVVIGYYWKNYTVEGTASAKMAGDAKIMPYPYYRNQNFTRVDIYDVSDITNPVSMRQVEVEGNYLSSRKIGNYLYFLTNYYIYNYNPIEGTTPPDGVVPMLRDTVSGGEFQALDFRCIQYFPDFNQSSYLNVAGLDISDNSRAVSVESYLGGGQNIYVSTENMYVAAQTYERSTAKPEPAQTTGGATPTIMPPIWDYSKPVTKVFKFGIQNGQINYVATGEVDGTILNQFSMDEYKGDFRIATNTWDVNKQYNNLFVLDSGMQHKGKITDIAPGERIYSTRFMGDKAYMVTFRQVDPLFVIDLSDGAKPVILGQLKIPGYSDYLHPYDETHIIGFGKDADENGRAMGMKMAIFDVSDFANPKEMYKEYIGDRGTHSPLLYNHKALLFSKERNLLAFPVSLYEIPEANKNDKNAYGMFSYQGLYVYDISLENGFSLRGRISHITEDELKKFGNVVEGSSAVVERGLYIGDSLYTVSEFGIMANNLKTLEQEGLVNY